MWSMVVVDADQSGSHLCHFNPGGGLKGGRVWNDVEGWMGIGWLCWGIGVMMDGGWMG